MNICYFFFFFFFQAEDGIRDYKVTGVQTCALPICGFDLCVATDGDADRVGIVDGRGTFITQLQVYALLMRYLIEVRGWKGPVVRSINMTSMADRLGEIYGVPVHEVPVGFKNIAPKMMQTGAGLGGEESGGFAFRGPIPERGGILA